MPDIQITKQLNITVDKTLINSYGDLQFTDTAGNNYKVGVKRVQHFKDKITPGATVTLNYAEAYGKEYIYSAIPQDRPSAKEMVDKVFPEPAKPAPAPAPSPQAVQSNSSVVKPQVNDKLPPKPEMYNSERIKYKSMCLAYAKDLCATAGVIAPDDITKWADKFMEWLIK